MDGTKHSPRVDMMPLAYSTLCFTSIDYVFSTQESLLAVDRARLCSPTAEGRKLPPLLREYDKILEGIAQAGDQVMKAASAP